MLLGGCAGERPETFIELADFAAYQRDQVSTGLVAPGDELLPRLATYGWRLEPAATGGTATMALSRNSGRLRFFSADGRTRGVELRGGLQKAKRHRGRSVVYRLNGESAGHFTLLPGTGAYVLLFESAPVRIGWNTLELRPRRAAEEAGEADIRLRSLRFLDPLEGPGAPRREGRIEVAGGLLRMPSGSYLDAVFELPQQARFAGELSAEDDAETSEPLEIVLELTGRDGQLELSRTALAAGESAAVDLDLTPWSGQRIRLRARAEAGSSATAVWREARVTATAPAVPPFGHLIRPARPDRSSGRGRLGKPDIVLILLDAARADAFSPWGGPYRTPALESLAADGTLFERALAPSSWTGQSMPAIFTGFHADTVGVHKWGDSLTDAVPTLAELFTAAGYRTALWSQHPLYSRGATLSRGFAETVYAGRRKRDRLPEIETLLGKEDPSFVFLHLLPPHSPYNPPPPFERLYTSWYHGQNPPALGNLNRYPKRRDPAELSTSDRKYIRDRYQENVAFADSLVGRLVDALKSVGRYDETLIVVLSDHGEGFLEHDRFMHSRRLYREFLHVPLVVKWPAAVEGFRPVVEESVSLVDLAPTLISGTGIDGGERGFQGSSLLPAAFDGARRDRALYAVTRGDGDPLRAPKPWMRLERQGWALLWDPLLGRVELYDLGRDPGEQRDLSSSRPLLALELLQELRMQSYFNRTLLGLETTAAGELDAELAAELKALGYL